jgi:hypothetical protein
MRSLPIGLVRAVPRSIATPAFLVACDAFDSPRSESAEEVSEGVQGEQGAQSVIQEPAQGGRARSRSSRARCPASVGSTTCAWPVPETSRRRSATHCGAGVADYDPPRGASERVAGRLHSHSTAPAIESSSQGCTLTRAKSPRQVIRAQ